MEKAERHKKINELSDELIFKIQCIAKVYGCFFADKKVVYDYVDEINKRRSLTIEAEKKHFMHLCGIKKYTRNLSRSSSLKGSVMFFDDAVKDDLKAEYVIFATIDEVNLKLSALENLEMLFKKDVRVCNTGGQFSKLRYDKAVRTNRILLALGLIKVNDVFITNSTLNLQASKSNARSIEKTCRVIGYSIKDLKTNEVIANETFPYVAKAKSKKKAENKRKKKNKSN